MANPTSVKTGSKFPFQQPGRCGRNESGTFTDVVYETTNEVEAQRMLLLAETGGTLYDYTRTFGKHTIVYHFPYNFLASTAENDPPINLWELTTQTVLKDILDSTSPIVNAIPAGWVYYLRMFQQNPSDFLITLQEKDANGNFYNPSFYALTGTPWFSDGQNIQPPYILPAKQLPFPSTSDGAKIAAMIGCGMTSYPVFAPQLKHTKTVNARYPIRPRNVNIGSVITTSTMYNIESIPNNVLFDLPDYIDPAIPDGKPVLRYGWLKNAPQVNQIARLKFQIVETWDYGLWPVAIYGNPL